MFGLWLSGVVLLFGAEGRGMSRLPWGGFARVVVFAAAAAMFLWLVLTYDGSQRRDVQKECRDMGGVKAVQVGSGWLCFSEDGKVVG